MAMTLITTNTSSDAATSDFTSSIDSTYKLYIFKYYDVNPATDNTNFTFQGSIDGGSSYGVEITSTSFRAYHPEDDGTPYLQYKTATDLAQSTDYKILGREIGNGGDEGAAGELFLFNPSNTTYVKHFYATTQMMYSSDASYVYYQAGQFNNANDIAAIQFKMASGNMDAVIKMYGVG